MSTESLTHKNGEQDPNYQAYQAYTQDVGEKLGLEGIIRNKDLFEKAQPQTKQTDWFQQLNSSAHQKRRARLTQDQEIQIGLEMIPMFKAKEEEAQLKLSKISEVK